MKFRTKALGMLAGASLLVTATIFGTMAYLTDSKEAINTLTAGKVRINLDEATVNEYGQPTGGRDSLVKTYRMLPGVTYTKDPTVTVLSGSDESYVRVKVTFTNTMRLYDALSEANIFDPTKILKGIDATKWKLQNPDGTVDLQHNTITFEYRYYQPVTARNAAVKLPAVFDKFTIPTALTEYGINLLGGVDLNTGVVRNKDRVTIKVVANAIQAAGFNDANAAWAAFDAQNR